MSRCYHLYPPRSPDPVEGFKSDYPCADMFDPITVERFPITLIDPPSHAKVALSQAVALINIFDHADQNVLFDPEPGLDQNP